MNSIKIIRGNDTDLIARIRRKEGDVTSPYDLTGAGKIRVAVVGQGAHIFAKDVTVDGNALSFRLPGKPLHLGKHTLEITFTLDGYDKRIAGRDMVEVVESLVDSTEMTAIEEGAAIEFTLTVTPEVIDLGGFSGNYDDLDNKPDLSEFITRLVDDLANYYLKSETYTKEEVAALLAAIKQFHYEVYPTLASVVDPAGNVMYLIGPTGSGADKYEEYVYANDTFVKIGDTSVDLSGVQKFFTEPVNNMLAKEGDILYLAPIAYAENLQNSGDLSTIPIVQESVLKITNKNILFSTTLGKITITGSSPGWPSEILGTIEMVDDNGFRRMAVIDQNNVRHIINYNESFSLATIIHPYGWETPSSYISISETHDSGQTSMLTVVQIDNYRELSIKESRNGNWVDRLPAVVDTTPTSGSDNLVKSGGVADAIASRAQGFFSNTPDTPPVTPKEGDIWDRPAFSMVCAGTFIGGVNYLYLPRADMPVTIPLAEGATSISLTIVKTDSTQETLTDISEFPKTYPAGEVASFQAVAGLGTPTQGLPAAILEYHNGAWVDRLGVDNAPTQNSQNLVKSGGVYDAIAAKYTKPQTGIPATDLAEGVIPDISGKQNVYAVPTSQISSPKEGDITVIEEEIKVEDLQEDLQEGSGIMSLDGGTVLRIIGNSDAYQSNLQNGGKINIYGSIPGLVSGLIGSIEVRLEGSFSFLYVVDADNVAHRIGPSASYELPAIIRYSGQYEIGASSVSLTEVIETGEHSILPYIKIDSVKAKEIHEYKDGAWIDRRGFPTAFDSLPTEGSGNLIKSGGVAAGIKASAQSYSNNLTAPSSPKEGDIWDSPEVNSPAQISWAGQAYFYAPDSDYQTLITINDGATTVEVLVQKTDNTSETLTDPSEFPKIYPAGEVRYVSGSGIYSVYNYQPAFRKIYHNGAWVDIDTMFAAIDTVNVTVGNNSGTPQGSGSVNGNVLDLTFDGIKGPAGESAIRTRIDYAANENTQVGLAWDTVHVWPAVSGLDVTLAAAPADGKEHLLSIVFETPADITNFTLSLDPQHILWGSDINLSNVLKENTRYEISIPSTSMIALFTAATLPSNNS